VKNKGLMYRILLVVGLTTLAVVFLLPTMLGGSAGFLPKKRMRLGLDLQGGMHLVLTVDVDAAVTSALERMVDEMGRDLRKAGVRGSKVQRSGATGIEAVIGNESREKSEELIRTNFPNLKMQSSETRDNDVVYKLELQPQEVKRMRESAVDQSLETIRNRVDQFGVTEPTIQRQGDNDILVQLPGVQDPARAKELIGKTALLEFKLVHEPAGAGEYVRGDKPLPAGTQILYEWKKDQFGNRQRGEALLIDSRTLMTGDVLTDARVQAGNMPGQWVVAFTLDSRGGRTFEDVTSESVGRRLAIILDGKIDSAPVIKSRIPGGRGIIEGNFSIEEAKDLAIVLRSGALPAPVNIAEERTVGPSLGRDSIRQGMISFIVGASLVVIFMIVYYKGAGLLADMALIFNVLYLLAALAGFEATLTLPGIAGIVLTIGMAVDANVLINERIREELRLGKTVRAAVEAGYERALPAILDSNITTFLSGVILFQFGSGPVKGFAVTLCIGLVSSVFTAVVGTRIVYDYRMSRQTLKTLSI
jgi:preprotein translocase subunit SecD